MLNSIQKFFTDRIAAAEPSAQSKEHALQIAASVLLIEISRADASVSEEEESKIISVLENTFSLDQEESQALLKLASEKTDEATSFQEFTREINEQFSDQEKINLVKLLWEVALADGQIDKYEDFYIRKIADLIYVSHSDFIRMKHKAAGDP